MHCKRREALMRLIRFVFVALVVLLTIAVPSVLSQEVKAVPGEIPKFDVKKEVQIRGTIQEVRNYSCPVTGTVGTHLGLKTSDGPIEVHVAAAKFLQDYGIHFTANDEVVMIGTKGSYQGSPAFLPSIIMIGNNSYFVRGTDGKPLW